jgi:hypothetical protein
MMHDEKKERLQQAISQLNFAINKLKENVKGVTKYRPGLISILLDYPCLKRCEYDIKNRTYKNIDKLYTAKHNLVKDDIIEVIDANFVNGHTEVKSEHDYSNGKLDLSIEDNRIVINHQNRKIGVEVKSGTYFDKSSLNQVIRYLFDVDVLVFVRVPMQQVDVIYQKDTIDELVTRIQTIIGKIYRIIDKDTSIIPGDHCKGCMVECQFARPPRFSESRADLSDFGDYLKNIEVVKAEIIRVLADLLN